MLSFGTVTGNLNHTVVAMLRYYRKRSLKKTWYVKVIILLQSGVLKNCSILTCYLVAELVISILLSIKNYQTDGLKCDFYGEK